LAIGLAITRAAPASTVRLLGSVVIIAREYRAKARQVAQASCAFVS
jgi:hypothetical protein